METKTCKTCNKQLPIAFFRAIKQGDKIYYQTNKCKRCFRKNDKDGVIEKYYKPIPPETKRIKFDNETIKLIERIEFMRGYVDTLECFKLINEYQKVFDYSETGIPIEDELCYMWNRLKAAYKNN